MKIVLVSLRTFIVGAVISLAFIGSDCNNIIENVTNTCTGNQVDLVATWKFTQHLGGYRDICAGELVVFNTDGTATLTCPNQASITRSYTVSSNVLTYTETGVKYCISGDVNELQLSGINNDRILYYVKVISGDKKEMNTAGQNTLPLVNSSELIK